MPDGTIRGVETFVVRVWKPDEPASAGAEELRGIVERPGGLLVKPFHSAQELLDALRAEVSDGETSDGIRTTVRTIPTSRERGART
jgi:hypothetical protein